MGAFLLAACEYVRYLEAPQTTDRAYWCKLAYQMAYPVLSNMAKGELQKNMQLEVSPTWDGRNKKVAYNGNVRSLDGGYRSLADAAG